MLLNIILWFYRKKQITPQEREAITTVLLDKVHALPIRDVLSYTPGYKLSVDGKELTFEQEELFRNSLQALSESYALKAIRDQVAYECVKIGVLQGQTPEQIMFAKAALWYQTKENELITALLLR